MRFLGRPQFLPMPTEFGSILWSKHGPYTAIQIDSFFHSLDLSLQAVTSPLPRRQQAELEDVSQVFQ